MKFRARQNDRRLAERNTYEEYLEAADTLYEVVQLRSESIKGQIEGTIPSTGEEQRNSDALVDASHLDLSVMGSMDMGDPMREWDGADENPFSDKERADWEMERGSENMPDMNFVGSNGNSDFSDGLILNGLCLVLLIIAFIFVKAYHRRSYK